MARELDDIAQRAVDALHVVSPQLARQVERQLTMPLVVLDPDVPEMLGNAARQIDELLEHAPYTPTRIRATRQFTKAMRDKIVELYDG